MAAAPAMARRGCRRPPDRLHLIGAARDWDSRGREPGELYRGARLAAALDWSADHEAELNALEREFIDQSRQASDREIDRQRATNRRLRILLAGVGVFLIVAIAAGGLAAYQSQLRGQGGAGSRDLASSPLRRSPRATPTRHSASCSRSRPPRSPTHRSNRSLPSTALGTRIGSSIATRLPRIASELGRRRPGPVGPIHRGGRGGSKIYRGRRLAAGKTLGRSPRERVLTAQPAGVHAGWQPRRLRSLFRRRAARAYYRRSGHLCPRRAHGCGASAPGDGRLRRAGRRRFGSHRHRCDFDWGVLCPPERHIRGVTSRSRASISRRASEPR